MIQSTRQWFRRNRTSFAIGGAVLGAGYLATNYVLGKLTETRQRMSDERIAKENLRRRFEQNQEDCTFTVLAILPTAVENIFEALPVEQVLEELQQQRAERLSRSVAPSELSTADLPSIAGSGTDGGDSESFVHTSQIAESSNGEQGNLKRPAASRSKKTKAQLWNQVKIDSISRSFSLIYTLSLLTLLTRIQLNLLGRRNYLASVVSLASPPRQGSKINLENHDDDNLENAYGNDFETNRKYLSFSWWLLHRGCKDIIDKVTVAVQEVFGPLNPREDITLTRLSELTVLVRKKVEGFTENDRKSQKWLPYLLPPGHQEDYVLQSAGMSGPTEINAANAALRRLLDETSDLIDSPAFTHVLTLLLDSGFSLLIDTKIATLAYKIPPPSASGARVVEIVGPGTDVKAKVASTLATFSRQAHSIGSGGNNEYLTAMENVRDLEAFAAVVYSSNFEFEAPEQAGLNASWEQLAVPPSESGGVGGTSTAAATPAPSGPLKATDPKEEVPGGEGSLIDAGEVDMEKAWWKATASPSASPSRTKKASAKRETAVENEMRMDETRQDLKVPVPREYVSVQAPDEEVKVDAETNASEEVVHVDALKEDITVEADRDVESQAPKHEASKRETKAEGSKEGTKAAAPVEAMEDEVRDTDKTRDVETFPTPPSVHGPVLESAEAKADVPETAKSKESDVGRASEKAAPLEETAGLMPVE
ncbi:hypothetical protein FKW77_009733 [Venturia effusa]|uniref:Peroxin-3 n=1 Tax=Venturia effusa TaxID=50376 RepID=A0A517L4A5_9PEZI|nr:hypothetical protein FKW77_009733 [Venturia effusa]